MDPALHRRYRSITGCLSYLVNMTRPRVCILSAKQVRTIPRSRTFASCRAGICNMCAVLIISYLMSLNGGAIFWRSSRQGGVTLSSSEAEFVAASQAGQEVVYLRVLLRGFGYTQKKPTEIWEDNASCIMMSENLTNRDRRHDQDMSMSRYTISVTWFEAAM